MAILAANGLRDKYRNGFETYDQRIQLLHSERMELEAIEKRRLEDLLEQDRYLITAEVHKITEIIDSTIYPSLGLHADSPESDIPAQLKQRYPLLDELPKSVRKTYDPSEVKDKGFQILKSRLLFVRACFARNPELSTTQRNGCIDYVFNRLPNPVLGHPDGLPTCLEPRSTDSRLLISWTIGSNPFHDVAPHESMENGGPPPKDPEFIEKLPSLESTYPELSEVV
ncbi:unnamed protein product [Rhizoctonia solani]|uniref:Uncharacterized protein n=1 Tax=Rhizoctonia solani TaxID=456999 RepID=A0A8H2W6R5_9AGAM|nr:unnamed protein product [Rhizoctonia solani]